jgi:malate dehydrogenase (oxaloacetate-decarboxylating)(NADP+)
VQANLGVAKLLVGALQQRGLSEAAAKQRIWMVDSKGLITTDRPDLSPQKAEFAQDLSRLSNRGAYSSGSGSTSSSRRRPSKPETVQQLASIVQAVQPTALIGAAAVAGAFGQPVLGALVQVGGGRGREGGHVSLRRLAGQDQ